MPRIVRIENNQVVGVSDAPDNWQELDVFGPSYTESDILQVGEWVGPVPELPQTLPGPPFQVQGREIMQRQATELARKARQDYANKYPPTSINDLWPQLSNSVELYQVNGYKPYPAYPVLYGALSARSNVAIDRLTEKQLELFVSTIQKAMSTHIKYLQAIDIVYRHTLLAFEESLLNGHAFDTMKTWDSEWGALKWD